jgi:hypothetical protein
LCHLFVHGNKILWSTDFARLLLTEEAGPGIIGIPARQKYFPNEGLTVEINYY